MGFLNIAYNNYEIKYIDLHINVGNTESPKLKTHSNFKIFFVNKFSKNKICLTNLVKEYFTTFKGTVSPGFCARKAHKHLMNRLIVAGLFYKIQFVKGNYKRRS